MQHKQLQLLRLVLDLDSIIFIFLYNSSLRSLIVFIVGGRIQTNIFILAFNM